MTANQSTRLNQEIESLNFLTQPDTFSILESAADLFVQHVDDTVKIWASSRDWFMEEWGRDTFISLPGLLLTTGRYDEAKHVFLQFAQHEQNGLIPNVIRNNELAYNTADAPLWFVHALKAYVIATGDWSFVGELMPRVRNIIAGYTRGATFGRSGRDYRIYMDEDGLIVSPPQATWMDADPAGDGSTPVTPRDGKCVDINALWYGVLRFAITAEKALNVNADTTELETRSEQVKSSFRREFWNENSGCLYDVIGDGAVRPNQLIAISHGEDLLDAAQQAKVLGVVQRELLTPGGLRTLSPQDPMYRGEYDTSAPMSVKDLAYHQGTVWPWLIGPYCEVVNSVRNREGVVADAIRHEIGTAIAPLVQFCLDSEFKSLPEVFSGDYPYEPGGTTSQAWSVAEVLRVLKKFMVK